MRRGKASRDRYRAKMKENHNARSAYKSSLGAMALMRAILPKDELEQFARRFPIRTVPWAAANRPGEASAGDGRHAVAPSEGK